MSIPIVQRFCVLVSLVAALLGTGGAAGAEPAGQRTWLWVSPAQSTQARHLKLEVALEETAPAAGIARFRCSIRSDFEYRGARLRVAVLDENATLTQEGGVALDIDSGATTCQIKLDSKELAPGNYRVVFSIAHGSLLSEPTQELVLRKVSADKLLEELASSSQQIEALDQSLEELAEAGQPRPYLRLKANLVADQLGLAEQDVEDGAWESLEQRLRYARDRIGSIRAGIVFGDTHPELSGAVEMPSLAEVGIKDGSFTAGGRPVFLFGGALPARDPEMLAELHRYQLHAATVTLGLEDGAGSAGELQDLFDGAVAHNIAMAVQLAPGEVPPALIEAHPSLKPGGHVDIARPALLDRWEAFVAEIGPLLAGQPMLAGISLAEDPRFHFEGAEVKAGFLDYLRSNYPDRLTLNRSWRAHLASLEDIELWSEDPYDTYQQHRPYQFDWQTYHQSLGNSYFNWSRRLVRQYIPDTPLAATLPNAVFTNGETRYGVNREHLADMMQFSSCSARTSLADPVYAMGYPLDSAYYTLLKSFEPEQPIFNLRYELDPGVRSGVTEAYRFVHSTIWEGVMSGLGGATVPFDSLIFERPETLEAFATAALDINRLAPLVHAFQQAPADVGILFSYASKVFDDGAPHLESARNAFEGVTFGGYTVRFISEAQCRPDTLDALKVLVVPDTPALGDEAFEAISNYVENGGTVARTGTPIPYDEQGYSRGDLIRNTGNTVLVRGLNLPTEYLHAMDAATALGALPQIPRPITGQGYPVEGLKSRYVAYDGEEYLYLLNLRQEPVYCALATQSQRGRDLIQGQDVAFPTTIEPLTPMLLRLEPAHLEVQVTAVGGDR